LKKRQKIGLEAIREINIYFDAVYSSWENNGKCDIFTVDETGFKGEMSKKALSWGFVGKGGNSYILQEAGHQNTVVTCINSSSGEVFNYFIPKNDSKQLCLIGNETKLLPKTKGLTNEIYFDRCFKFVAYLKGRKVILLMDNLEVHFDPKSIAYLQKNNVVIIKFPKYLAYMLSILDRLLFGIAKKSWYRLLKISKIKSNIDAEEGIIRILSSFNYREIKLASQLCGLPIKGSINNRKPVLREDIPLENQINNESFLDVHIKELITDSFVDIIFVLTENTYIKSKHNKECRGNKR
jgi:hypothetical protein